VPHDSGKLQPGVLQGFCQFGRFFYLTLRRTNGKVKNRLPRDKCVLGG
jgi:hypothetical protein